MALEKKGMEEKERTEERYESARRRERNKLERVWKVHEKENHSFKGEKNHRWDLGKAR